MMGYEFTERGKVIIVVLVIAILVIPASVIAFRAWSSSIPSDDNGRQMVQPTPDDPPPDEYEPVLTASPPPDDNGDHPVDPPGEDNGEHASFNPPVEPQDEPDELDDPGDPGGDEQPTKPELPEIGPVSIDRSAGTMHFMFAPDLQESLDADTITMLGDFITSPRNTNDSRILVEIPVLPAAQTTILTLAIADAFSQYGVSQRALTFEAYPSDPTTGSFEIILSFTQTSSPK